ncbi:MAG: leucyl/phenylalanyl-tRNA--protein transferase [Candidatus Eremiobacteraeota bacterium]|nr:leucyl/phenylalanyl-tRNA--protein transferase [Candidatus Eremiobacteraeota bacterium]MCW5870120.1 leucyl/phenylalanyl-tRNA--protein transferase [Candidatus Eremiobacteraeota bacterium]
MADQDGRVRAYCYDPRGVLPLAEFHIPRRLTRWLRRQPYRLTLDQAFPEVIRCCGQRNHTWLCPEIESAFCELHQAGLAHSLEAWQGEQLVGGLYGLALGGTFCGESMFSSADNASKACLVELYRRMCQGGFDLIDCQDVTSTLAQFGARHIPFAQYFEMFRSSREKDCKLDG